MILVNHYSYPEEKFSKDRVEMDRRDGGGGSELNRPGTDRWEQHCVCGGWGVSNPVIVSLSNEHADSSLTVVAVD